MSLDIQYFDAAGTSTIAGVFIPLLALTGIVSTELADSEPIATKEGKVILSLLNRIFDVVSQPSFIALGLTITKNTPAGTGANRISQTFSATYQKLVDLSSNTVELIPVPSVGANAAVGDFSLLDIFPNAEKVAAAGAVSGAGIVIATSPLADYDSEMIQANITIGVSSDNRNYISALLTYIAVSSILRSASVVSAITALTNSAIGAIAIPANFTQPTDPVSGILAADLPKLGLITKTLSFTVELELNNTSQTFDVRVATT